MSICPKDALCAEGSCLMFRPSATERRYVTSFLSGCSNSPAETSSSSEDSVSPGETFCVPSVPSPTEFSGKVASCENPAFSPTQPKSKAIVAKNINIKDIFFIFTPRKHISINYSLLSEVNFVKKTGSLSKETGSFLGYGPFTCWIPVRWCKR